MDLVAHPRRGRPAAVPRRGADGLGREFRRFACAQAASLTGTAMAGVALAFAVLATGRGGAGLGMVLAARMVPLVLMLLVGGTAADRFGSRRVMLGADLLRCVAQAAFGLLVLSGSRALAPMLVLAALAGVGEAGFGPGQSALVPGLVRADLLVRANATLAMLRSAATVLGPVLAGGVLAWAGRSDRVGPAAVLLTDAVTFALSALALRRLVLPEPVRAGSTETFLAELRAGWGEFRTRNWLWTTTLHMALFNLLVWAPYLVLGPLLAARDLGGAGAWGAIMGCYGAGALLGAVVVHARRPARPLPTAVLTTTLFAAAPATLALGLPLVAVCGGAVVSGVASSACGTLFAAVNQRRIPPALRGRLSAYGSVGSFGLGPLGLVAAGPVAAVVGARRELALGVVWLLAAAALVATLPAVHAKGVDDGERQPA
ncbi:MFS transporter [Streptacidiphilus pinicola]|uniref:MFS transporter n=1 Tax=Streptacidiphilus pinicola TaxID=2219663 RepID=A0A2X0K3W6_9ACTN|nr:MFS transporter [Streptacidiphilus pinicola]RAG83955.1 MFS transporter [Streptacidiphilus pinicola]